MIFCGVLDSDTRNALEEFQLSQGLAVTGEPDENTRRALAPSVEQQELFGLSANSDEGESLEERETFEQKPVEEERIQKTPVAVD